MAMNFGTLNGQLNGTFTALHPAHEIPGIRMANAFFSYVSTCNNLAGGSFAGMPGISALRSQLGSIFRAKYPSGVIAGNRAGIAIVNCLITLKTVYQIGAPNPVQRAGFVSRMQGIFNTLNPHGLIFAYDVSRAIQTLCTTTIIRGVVPGSPPWYFTGNLS